MPTVVLTAAPSATAFGALSVSSGTVGLPDPNTVFMIVSPKDITIPLKDHSLSITSHLCEINDRNAINPEPGRAQFTDFSPQLLIFGIPIRVNIALMPQWRL
jgi:hypothetical protein